MDIIKEIAKIKLREGNSELILNELQEEKNNIDKQIHIINTISLACDIQDMIKSGDFAKFNVDRISLMFFEDRDYGNIIRYAFYDKNGTKIQRSSTNIFEVTDK